MSRVPPSQAWENFRRRVTELGGEVLEPQYLGSGVGHRCRCPNGHECRPRPNHVQQGRGLCRACVRRDPAAAWENFRQRVAELGGTVLEPRWLGDGAPHRCRCAEGHACRPRPGGVQKGRGICRICAGRDPATAWENFRRLVAEQGGTVLETAWGGNHTPILIRCHAGHERRVEPANIQTGQGICRTCAYENNPLNAQRAAVAEGNFRRRVAELGGVVLEPEYLGALVPHRCRCANGHACKPWPTNIQQGQGICEKCAGKVWDALYVVRNPVTGWVKFGITGRDGRDRLSKHRKAGYTEVLRLETGLPEGLAALTEQKIKVALGMAGAMPVRGSEYFDGEYLALILNEIGNWVPSAAEPAA